MWNWVCLSWVCAWVIPHVVGITEAGKCMLGKCWQDLWESQSIKKNHICLKCTVKAFKKIIVATFLLQLYQKCRLNVFIVGFCKIVMSVTDFIPTELSLGESFSLHDLCHLLFLLGFNSLTFHLSTVHLTWSSSYTIAFPLLLRSVPGDKQIICASMVVSLWHQLIWWLVNGL